MNIKKRIHLKCTDYNQNDYNLSLKPWHFLRVKQKVYNNHINKIAISGKIRCRSNCNNFAFGKIQKIVNTETVSQETCALAWSSQVFGTRTQSIWSSALQLVFSVHVASLSFFYSILIWKTFHIEQRSSTVSLYSQGTDYSFCVVIH